MNPNDLLAAITGVQAISANLRSLVDGPNAVTHVVRQLQVALDEMRRGAAPGSVKLEQARQTSVEAPAGGGVIDVNRIVDVVSERVIQGVKTEIHIETKTGEKSILSALNLGQLEQDAALAIQKGVENGRRALVNIWDLSGFDLSTPENKAAIKGQLGQLRDDLIGQGFSQQQVRLALSSFNFADKLGNTMQAAMNEKGEIIFKPAMKELFDENGLAARVAKKEAGDSPNFGPAFALLFGPDGKLASAARGAAAGTNLAPALEGFEKKVESGVNTALDAAGNKAQAHAAAALGSKLKEGAGALGGILTSIPALYNQVNALGEAWDKPNKSTADYMNLMSQLGGTITQGADTIEKLAGVTKIATAVQAAFNFVMALNPIVLVVLAVLALIAGIALLIIYWDEVKAAIRDNPWIGLAAVLLGIIAPILGIIAVVVLLVAYWDEVKLAFLKAANFMSIQVQRIGLFFVGLKNLIGMVWDWVVGSVYNLGVGIINGFIEFGASIVNFFINLLNTFIGIYNDVAAWVPGLDEIAEIEQVNVEKIKIAEKELPEIDVGKAFAHGEVTGGLEGQIAKQQEVVRKADEEDKARREKSAIEKRAGQRFTLPGEGGVGPGLPAAPAAPPLPSMLAPGAGPSLPALPGGALPLGAMGGGPDQSVHVEGGIHITITADRLEADSAKLLTDEMVRQLQERLDALRSDRDRRVGVRAPAAA
jgi:hypothetical protein